ncbi:MAG: response regulator [Methylocella sp.]
MFFKEWPVLLVDDEPDVLAVSKLAMKNFAVYGLPLKIYTAASKADAIRLLNDNAEVACSLAVAFLDVVMENDKAGLELCDYIRNDTGNTLTQIFIRTGQPGLAPEREVVDKYDINGYFTKVEATEDKLYSLVKSAVRQYLSSGMALATVELLNNLMAAGGARQKVLYAVSSVGGLSEDQTDTPRWLIVEDQVLFSEEVDGQKGLSLRDKLRTLPTVPLNPFGDNYVRGEDGYQMIEVAKSATKSATSYLFKTCFTPPEHIVNLMHSFVTGLAIAWRQSKEDE